ncbi:MAG: hypothetical protein ACT4PI_16115 [Actinomycetota bacterium]
MGELNAHGVAVDVPSGWDGRIFRRPEHGEVSASDADGPPGARTHSVTHISNVPLTEGVADFGSDAVERLGPDDALIVLFEYDPASSGTALFAAPGLPRALDPDAFSPNLLQRTLPNQAGAQLFFSEQGRAFSLYVVIGSHQRRHDVVPRVNSVLKTIRIEPLMPADSSEPMPAPTTTTTMPPGDSSATTSTSTPPTAGPEVPSGPPPSS